MRRFIILAPGFSQEEKAKAKEVSLNRFNGLLPGTEYLQIFNLTDFICHAATATNYLQFAGEYSHNVIESDPEKKAADEDQTGIRNDGLHLE
jgi:hypothetical protein